MKKWSGITWFAMTTLVFVGPPRRAFSANVGTCASQVESGALDFWVGEWNIRVANENVKAVSRVSRELGDCVVVERWDGGDGHIGENIFGYSADDKSWHGMFADSVGHVHVFVDGRVAAQSAEFNGPSRGPQGETVLNRITIRRIGPDQVKQRWVKSSDGGKTWTTVFDGEYTRKS